MKAFRTASQIDLRHLRYLALLCAELSTSYQPVAWPSTKCDCLFSVQFCLMQRADTIFTYLYDLVHATQGVGLCKIGVVT